ncbi:MAG: universal stress protein [Actinobacteria bacterium]|nr:universal stress protein [Actinomycetota bacterium]
MTVVVGFVPTPEGWAAIEAATDAARVAADRLVVVNTSRGDAYADPRYAQEHHLAELRGRLDAAGVPYEVVQRMRGRDGAEEVLAAAEEHAAGLVVIGLRHRTPVGKLLLGSTAQRILLEADCPVLAVKAAATPA